MATSETIQAAESVPDAGDLRDEIAKKLSQAKGICIVICEMHGMANTPVSASLWAVDELIADVQRAFKELKAVQS